MPKALAVMLRHIRTDRVKAVILSHQDPDIIGGLAFWLEILDCPVYISRLWTRFLPHYGIRRRMTQFIAVPDEGMEFAVAPGLHLKLIPAHFLHSEGHINVYDPVSKILFSGDIGAGLMPLDRDITFVDDFKDHLRYIEGFHRRYMGCNRATRIWARNISTLDVDIIAPQHGPIYRGQAVRDFIQWMENLKCGTDLMDENGKFPKGV